MELAPSFAPARSNLARTLLDIGEPEEALAHCREAVRLDPDLSVPHFNLANALRRLGDTLKLGLHILRHFGLNPILLQPTPI